MGREVRLLIATAAALLLVLLAGFLVGRFVLPADEVPSEPAAPEVLAVPR